MPTLKKMFYRVEFCHEYTNYKGLISIQINYYSCICGYFRSITLFK